MKRFDKRAKYPGVGKGYRAPHKVLFWRKAEYDPATGCIIWIGARNDKGYAHFGVGGKTTAAYRWIWERNEGPIPQGMELDHLCRNRACVNLLHLEVVTHRENVRRGHGVPGVNARRTHCIRGHEFTAENTVINSKGNRNCLICLRVAGVEKNRRYRARQKALR